jgi:signal peptidase II
MGSLTALIQPTFKFLGVAIAVLVLAVDQLTKVWVLDVLDLAARGTVPVLGPLDMTMVFNRGVSFGFFSGQNDAGRWIFAAFSTLVAVALIIWSGKHDRLIVKIAAGLLAGGAIGNAIDRVRIGAVIDFIDVRSLYFPWIFNVADSAISIGVVLLLLDSFVWDRPQPGKGAIADPSS